MIQKHAKLSASSFYRWSACPGSVRLSENIPDFESEYAKEGTEAHRKAADLLIGGYSNPYGVSEELDAIQLYVDTIRHDAEDEPVEVELPLSLASIHPDCAGTADAVIHHLKEKLLRVYDFKFGKGVLVEVENNPQLKYYSLGALLTTGYPCKEVELVIVQPRAEHPDGPIRRHRFMAIELLEFAADLKNYALATEDPKAALVPGPHCRFCRAIGICPAIKDKSLAIAQKEFSDVQTYDPVALSETLRKLDLLESYAKGVREFAYREAENGRCPPGWKLVAKRAVRKWNGNVAANLDNEFGLGSEMFEPQELKSPAQIEKLLPKNNRHLLEKYVSAVSSGSTLVPDEDPRIEVKKGVDEFDLIAN